MTNEKIRKRIQKLLALASPAKNDNKAEREQAAIEAAKLISEHGLFDDEVPPPPRRKRQTPPPPRPAWHPPAWLPAIAVETGHRCTCGAEIMYGEHILIRIDNAYLHADWPWCGER